METLQKGMKDNQKTIKMNVNMLKRKMGYQIKKKQEEAAAKKSDAPSPTLLEVPGQE